MKDVTRRLLAACCSLTALASGGCMADHRVKVDPIAVQPIHVEVDVNVHDSARPDTKPVAPAKR